MSRVPLCQHLVAAFLGAALGMVGGCDWREESSAATQVAAQVNSDEITVHQINAVLARTASVTPETAMRAKREVLERLIDQRLAVQQALDNKLDRSPAVLQALEGARAEILARAFADEVARSQPKPSPDEVSKFYAEHPELFAQRRVFVLEEIEISGGSDLNAGLKEVVGKARSMQEVAAWLRARDVKFKEGRGVRTAEQIPLETLPRLQSMRDGDFRVIEEGAGRTQVIRVVTTSLAPVDETAATPRIQQFLFNRRTSEALAREMQRLKEAATIRYLGEFAGMASAGKAAVQTAGQAGPKEEAGRPGSGAKTEEGR